MKTPLMRCAGFGLALLLHGLVASVLRIDANGPVESQKKSPSPIPVKAASAPRETPARGGFETPLGFEVIEKVSAQAPIADQEKSRVAAQKFPRIRFRWNAPVSALAPAFLFETGDGRILLGKREIRGDDQETLGRYSKIAAIRAADGRLRLHLAVVARLGEWVQQSESEFVGSDPIEVGIEPQANEQAVAFRLPPVGSRPARTLLVTL